MLSSKKEKKHMNTYQCRLICFWVDFVNDVTAERRISGNLFTGDF